MTKNQGNMPSCFWRIPPCKLPRAVLPVPQGVGPVTRLPPHANRIAAPPTAPARPQVCAAVGLCPADAPLRPSRRLLSSEGEGALSASFRAITDALFASAGSVEAAWHAAAGKLRSRYGAYGAGEDGAVNGRRTGGLEGRPRATQDLGDALRGAVAGASRWGAYEFLGGGARRCCSCIVVEQTGRLPMPGCLLSVVVPWRIARALQPALLGPPSRPGPDLPHPTPLTLPPHPTAATTWRVTSATPPLSTSRSRSGTTRPWRRLRRWGGGKGQLVEEVERAEHVDCSSLERFYARQGSGLL